MKLDTKLWLKFSIINLMLVSILGVLMRYKIGFEFPYLNQKYLQHAHSHFAFVGWITSTLYVLMVDFIQSKIPLTHYKQYKVLLLSNLICAYGMLISFTIGGYSIMSIVFSIGTIVISCFYMLYFYKDLNKIEKGHPSISWFKAALWFNALSSLGTFYLAYMMTSKNFNQNLYLSSVYFFLHFQYNGFFIFTCMGLAYKKIQKVLPLFKPDASIFRLFFYSFFPAYFLSLLWAKIPMWLYVIVVLSAFMQVYAWGKFAWSIKNSFSSMVDVTKFAKYLFLFVAIAFSLKLLLQLGSTIPIVSKLAFGFRPVVIAYLHLVLLAVISIFLLAYMYTFKLIKKSKLCTVGIGLFTLGVLLNEIVLGGQGIASFSFFLIPKVNETLFSVSVLLLISLILLVLSQSKLVNNQQ